MLFTADRLLLHDWKVPIFKSLEKCSAPAQGQCELYLAEHLSHENVLSIVELIEYIEAPV